MLDSELARKLIRLAIEEDLSKGDITTELSVARGEQCNADLVAKESLVVCGLPIVAVIFEELGWPVTSKLNFGEGILAGPGSKLVSLAGEVSQILSAERTILNFLQRLSGVATYTRRMVELAPGLKLLDTRKTTPGWRVLEKYAVRVGGASNHRFGLGDMILVKNNHVDANGGDMTATLEKVFSARPKDLVVEVEVRNFAELEASLKFGPQIIMLDNMNNAEVRDALAAIRSQRPGTVVEVSGGLDAARLAELKTLGVDCASMGALTTKAVNVDISLRVNLKNRI